MSRSPSLPRLFSASAVSLLLLAGCGSGADDRVGTAETETASSPSSTIAGDGDTVSGTTGGAATTTGGQTTVQGTTTVTGSPSPTTLPPPAKPTPGATDKTPTNISDLSKPGATVGGSVPAAQNTSAIQGFWDFSTTEGPVDRLYELISADGHISYFDWDNDDYGTGRDCFDVETYSFTALGNDRYSFDGTVLTMKVIGDLLHVSEAGGEILTFPERVSIDPSLLVRCD